jgi:hypothetical protein
MISLIMVISCSGAFADRIIFVDNAAEGTNNGSSWMNAYKFLQDALTDANSANKPVEIRVAQGIYKPDMGAGQIPGDRDASFVVINNVTLSGGYAGFFEPDPNERDYEKYETILSGDLAGNDIDVDELVDLLTEPTRRDNSYHVVTAKGTDETAIIKGLTITGGNASSGNSLYKRGGGVYCGEKSFEEKNGGPTIMQCTITKNISHSLGGGINDCGGIISECVITENIASWSGGGLFNCTTIIDSEITYNTANDGGNHSAGGSGGGLSNCEIISHCIISHNSAASSGGGLIDCGSITDCIVNYNFAESRGGGILFSGPGGQVHECIIYGNKASFGAGIVGSKVVRNCVITGNYANGDGGGANGDGGGVDSCSILMNCTITSNRAKNRGGGIRIDGKKTIMNNTILWANTATWGNQILLSGYVIYGPPGYSERHYGIISIQNSDVQGGDTGIFKEFEECEVEWLVGNIDADPLFADPGYWDPNGTQDDPNDDFWVDGDYHLKSVAGRYDPNSDSWVKDDVNSPCIDAGDPNTCIGFEPNPNGDIVNMGAYGGTAEASISPSGVKCISIEHPEHPGPTYTVELDDWVLVGEPVCWCYHRQCHGDADCKFQGKDKYWVSTNDLDVLIAAWNKRFVEIDGKEVNGIPLICADFDHLPQGKKKYRVSINDLDILIANWNKANKPDPNCP